MQKIVITKDMPVSGIASSWEETKPYESNKALKEHLQDEQLISIITEINKVIGTTEATCI
ncbi:hypothetical protein FS935_00400 [Metabacillus litoralis]|uniref:Uncharacterized protein n=1 Tax=Metabacillus litoralis TaxID=152268 RepID=A0A5C6W448_9BACI|nr:hypothetical protein [Metabacillus litoralis]TXC92706.1 hypothetical protein FS935_00400 [Metabacillus litoralis]